MIKNKDTIKQDPESYVQQLLDLYRQFSNLVRDAFLNDPRFLTSRDKGFRERSPLLNCFNKNFGF